MGCIIHIGMHKTGSTSIQISLQGFSDDRFLYADLGDGPNHSLAMYSLFAEHPERHHLHKAAGLDRSAVQDYVAKVRIDLEQAISTAHGRTLLISGEDISALQKNDLDKLHRYFREHFDDLMICGYVRPPAGYISSEFQEGVKGGVVDRVSLHQRYRHYEKTFRKFDEIFGRENVHLWKFEPKSFPGGCVVQDFCARLDISFQVKRVIRANESLSRQAVSLLYTYRRFSKKRGFRGMAGAESQRVMERLGDIQHDKFRLSPAIVRPVLEANRADIQWMEERLGQSLDEELGAYRPGDVRDEADLLKPDPEVVKKLLALLGDAAPAGIKGETPEEVAVLVHALRENRGDQVGTLIEQIRKTNPEFMEDTPGDKAEALTHKVFKQINQTQDLNEADRWGDAIRQVNPASQEYLDASRITQSSGHLDVVDERFCSGWAFYPKQPGKAANVNVFVNDQLIHTVTAKLPRPDVKENGTHPTGLCGFRYEWPEDERPKVGDQVEVRLEGDVKPLAGSPKPVRAARGKRAPHGSEKINNRPGADAGPKGNQVGILIEQIRKTNPEFMEDIPGDKAEALIRKVFTQMSQTLATTKDGVVTFMGLGQFQVRKIEKELEGKKVTRTQIVFTRF